MIIVGMVPIVYFYCWKITHNAIRLSVPLSLAQGEYTSPLFRVRVDDCCGIRIALNRILDGQDSSCMQGTKVIDSTECQGIGRILDADWEVVSDRGEVISRGTYKDRIYTGTSSEAWIGRYVATRGSRQRITLRIHEDVQGYETANPRLEIQGQGDEERAAYAGSAAILWAFVWAGSGVIILLVLKFRR